MAKIRTCLVCKTEYEYCRKCDKSSAKKLWKNTFCCENCRDVYNVVNKYMFGHITEAQARALIKSKGLDVSKKNKFDKEIKKALDVILATKEDEKSEDSE